MRKYSKIFCEKSNTSDEYVQSESDGLSVVKVLNAISDDKSWSLIPLQFHRLTVPQMDNNTEMGVRSL